jgi:amino-acid N-acetyltransferase
MSEARSASESCTEKPAEKVGEKVGSFSEKGFYLREFRGRTVGVLLPPGPQNDGELRRVFAELHDNATWVIAVAAPGRSVAAFDGAVVPAGASRLEGEVWRALRGRGGVVVESEGDAFETLLDLSARLALHKVVRLSELDGVAGADGRRRPFVDLDELEAIRAGAGPELRVLLLEIERLLQAGVPNVNLCTAAGMHAELFTYSGSGTLFTRERYVVVRRLSIDDYDAADDLIARGVAEGFLASRSPEAIERLLPDSFGAFVEGRHLAGIGALLVPAGARGGEVASLYTVTRFTGQGLGAHLVRHAVRRARDRGLDFVYACTTSERVGTWFEGLGFAPCDQQTLPAEKWEGYDEDRRRLVACFRRDV